MNTRFFSKISFIVLMAVFGLQGCKKETDLKSDLKKPNASALADGQQQQQQYEGVITLGPKLPNPYTVENMQAAFDRIANNFPLMQSPVRITGKYLKFSPRNEMETSILNQDETLITYTYPLDHEILSSGSFYMEASVMTAIADALSCTTCEPVAPPEPALWCAIRGSQTIPGGIPYVVLADLYIPETDLALASYVGTSYSVTTFVDALLTEAFSLVGLTVGAKSTSSWTPSGKMRVWDDFNSTYVGVEGVEVRARRWFTTHRGLTDGNGDYTCDGSFDRDANYSMQWDRQHFSIRSGTYGQAVYNGPKQDWNWSVDINSNPQMYYARIFRAAYQYYYQNIDGLHRPPLNTSLIDPQLKIAAYTGSGPSDITGSCAPWKRVLGLGNFIKLYDASRNISSIHGTTIHELGHAAHWEICSPKSKYNDADLIVCETWARGAQWWLTRKYFGGYQPNYWTGAYTGLVEDMIDGTGSLCPGAPFGLADHVAGYTIVEVEQGVKNQKTWADWKNNMISTYTNPTEGHLSNMFNAWQ